MTRDRKRLCNARVMAFLLTLSAWLVVLPTRAGGPDDLARAEALFLEGQKLFDSGRIEAACGKFEKSLAIVRTSGALVNLARCHAAQGKTATAWREYKDAAELAAKAGETERANGARDLAAELEPRLSKLTIRAPGAPEGLAVSRNGEPVPAAQLGVAVPVDPGNFRIVARLPRKDAWETTVRVKPEGDSVVVEVPLPSSAGDDEPVSEPSKTPTKPESADEDGGMSTLRITGIAVGTVGAVAAIIGGVLGGLTLAAVSDAESDDALCGADHRCTPEGVEHIDSARNQGIASTALLAIGGALVGTGIVLIIVGGDTPSQQGTVTLAPTAGGARLAVRFH